ncbi:DUF563 domain-containing protein [Variovorax sp. KBW07]|uniref:glycosyltransferase family 61 protein n=1 Tax=Variovorax sp. KBW07 TaxID=2153358 RepID=UPI000F57CE41|nr:glycosyltransferase family 61 protein [Variovorax sp. KBW07]
MRNAPAQEKKANLLEAAKGAIRRRIPRKMPSLAELFDADWYRKSLQAHEAVAKPWEHFLAGGFLRGNPNSMFDTNWYLDRHPELRAAQKNPLQHYLEIGERTGNPPSPRFDPQWYLDEYPDVAATNLSPLLHYLKFGAAEGRLPQRLAHFDSVSALSRFLAALSPSFANKPCSVDLPVNSVYSLASGETGAARIFHQAPGGFCEGVDGAPKYPKSAFVAEIDDSILIAGTRYLIGPGEQILHDENAHFINQPDAAIKYGKATRSPTPGHLNIEVNVRQAAWLESGLNIMHEYENNYFHFIAETIPRMILAEEAGVPADIPFLSTNELHPNIQRLFELANVGKRPTIVLEKGTLYRVKHMYYPSDLTSVVDAYEGGWMARQTGLDIGRIRKGVDRLRAAFPVDASARKRKIFAARDGSYRKLLNQESIEKRISDIGFEVLRTDDLDAETQIRIFQEAEVIVGPTGAQLTNLVWCRPGVRVIVLASDHPSHQLYFWQLLGRVSGATVTILQGPRAYARDDIYSVHDDYRVDEDAVIAAASGTE